MNNTCSITIDWNALTQQITDIDGSNPREIHWNVPHAVYKSETPMDDVSILGPPQAILPDTQVQWLDDEVTYDIIYYYRLAELRPGGVHFTEQVKIQVKHHILKYEAPYLANLEYDGGIRDANGNLVKMTQLNLEDKDASGNPLQTLRSEWFWDGEGRISEWLEFIVNDETIDIRLRGTFDNKLKTIVLNEDRRNYPAGKIGDMPVMSSSISLGRDNLVQTPYWWAEWHENVDVTTPETWHTFWKSRFGVWDDTEAWYGTDWTTNPNTIEYKDHPIVNMKDEATVIPYDGGVTDLVLRANKDASLDEGRYTGEVYNPITEEMEMGTVLGIPRPGNKAGVGLGATLSFKQVRRGLYNGATISFKYNGTNYSVTITGVPSYDPNDEEMKRILQAQLNAVIGPIPPGADEPFIAVSFGPRFHVM